MLIRDNWKFSFFAANHHQDNPVVAYVWATTEDGTIDEIQSQVDDTEVWFDQGKDAE